MPTFRRQAAHIQVPFGLYNSSFYSGTYVAALKNGVAAYQTANPNDGNVVLIDFGSTVAQTMTHSPYVNSDNVHPLASGHTLIAPMVAAALLRLLKILSFDTHTTSVMSWTSV